MPWNDIACAGTSSQCPGPMDTMLLNEPPQTVARTFARERVAGSGGPTSGTVYMRMIVLPAGFTAAAMTMFTTTTAKTGGTHGWYVVTDKNMSVLAVTADQTDAATTWGTLWAPTKLYFTSPLATAYTGIYYAGALITAGVMPALANSGTLLNAGYSAMPPVLGGTSTAGQTVPVPIGTVLAALTASPGSGLYITLQSG